MTRSLTCRASFKQTRAPAGVDHGAMLDSAAGPLTGRPLRLSAAHAAPGGYRSGGGCAPRRANHARERNGVGARRGAKPAAGSLARGRLAAGAGPWAPVRSAWRQGCGSAKRAGAQIGAAEEALGRDHAHIRVGTDLFAFKELSSRGMQRFDLLFPPRPSARARGSVQALARKGAWVPLVHAALGEPRPRVQVRVVPSRRASATCTRCGRCGAGSPDPRRHCTATRAAAGS